METAIEYKESLNGMSKSLHDLDRHVIGLAKIHGLVELVLSKDEDLFVTFRIGALLGSSTTHYPVKEFKHCIYMFPEGITLADMKRDPFKLNEFCEANKI